jgi:hypothetical protein
VLDCLGDFDLPRAEVSAAEVPMMKDNDVVYYKMEERWQRGGTSQRRKVGSQRKRGMGGGKMRSEAKG